MSANKTVLLLAILIVSAVFVLGCGLSNRQGDDSSAATTNCAVTTALDASFDGYDTAVWLKSDGWSNGRPFDCTWRASQVTFSGGIMRLALEQDSKHHPPYKSGEYRSNDFYGYGLYEVRMKPASNIGIVSSFFTYTGPSDNNPWDEIDIEFLGKDTTQVQLNYYTDGTGGHEVLINLGFDASAAYHTYAFDWEPGSITWYVDGNPVHTATANLPVTPGRIMMNLWPGTGVSSWLGDYDGTVPLYAYYDWVKYTPAAGTPSPTPTSTPPPSGGTTNSITIP